MNDASYKKYSQAVLNPILSIIVPVYNTGSFLRMCIESILNQEYTDFELILVNDGSREVILEYASKCDKIVFINNENPSGNPGTPRNQGLDIAKGTYIGFVDSDDWIENDFYQQLICSAEEHFSEIVFSSGFKNHIGEEYSVRKYNIGEFDNKGSSFYRYHESFMIWDKIYRRSLLQSHSIRLGTTKAAVDVPFIFRAYYYAELVSHCTNLIGDNYRREAPNSVTVNFRKSENCDFEFHAYEYVVSWSENYDVSKQFRNVIDIRRLMSYIYTLGLIDPKGFENFFILAKKKVLNLDRQVVGGFGKEMGKWHVVKSYDLIIDSTAQQYFNSTRLDKDFFDEAKPKFYLNGSSKGIMFFPVWIKGNPYQELFYKSINRVHDLKVIGYDPSAFTQQHLEKRRSQFDYIHLQWLQSFFGPNMEHVESFERNIKEAKRLGYKLIYTAQNVVSHKSANREQEVEVRKRLISYFDIIITHGELGKQRLIDEIGAVHDKIQVIPHGTYLDYYDQSVDEIEAKKGLGLKGDEFVILSFGQIRGYKGIIPLITRFKELNKKFDKVRLVIAGKPFTPELEDEIRKSLEEEHNILLFLHFIDNSEVQLFFKACDIFVLSYEKMLTSGSAILSLSFGNPVLAPKMGVLPELITSELGELFEDFDDMTLKLESMIISWKNGEWGNRFDNKAFLK